MFNEREALRLRLEQLNEAEVKVIREYQIERDKIYAKLRELDRNGSPSEIKRISVLKKNLTLCRFSLSLRLRKSEAISRNHSSSLSSLSFNLFPLFLLGIPDGTTRRRRGTARPDQKQRSCVKLLLKH